jgi:hypothetical protein
MIEDPTIELNDDNFERILDNIEESENNTIIEY